MIVNGPVLLLSFSLHVGRLGHASTSPSQGSDRWLSADKAKHVVTAAVAQSMAFSALRAVRVSRTGALVTSAGLAAGLGAGKELYDRKFGGDPSWKDLTADLVGIGAASVILAHTRR